MSEMFGVPATTLRYWEKEFPSIHPRKNSGNIRMYTRDDISEIKLVYDLIKVRNMKLSAAKELIRRNHEGARNSSDLMSRLLEVREQLLLIKSEMDKIV
ncbi:MAG: MerR family transcriptional regulator [Bacteroidaceae bacterium]|nr:MerR family transcriptional regulator [Bacteroidaceae bacterium]